MKIGTKIKELRNAMRITQEELADKMGVSIQTVSRWENDVNCPDISMLPILAMYFHTTTDNLLGLERINNMKLLKTVETFELTTEQEAKEMVKKFQSEKFPVLKNFKITTIGDKVILEVTKEFNADLNDMKF